MNDRVKGMTKYLRSAVAAQANMGIDFKVDFFSILHPYEVMQGRIKPSVCKSIFAEANKNSFHDEKDARKKPFVQVIICTKTIKTIFEANERTQHEIDELTGVYYVPAVLNEEGLLLFDEGEKKLPWFPREYLIPMIEPKLAIGTADTVDKFVSNHVDRIETIRSWNDYVIFFKGLYEAVADTPFEQNIIRNMDEKEPFFELENNMYLFLDKTVNSTFHIMNLYNHLQEDDQSKALYTNFCLIKRPMLGFLWKTIS